MLCGMTQAECPECHGELAGRVDQRFCSNACRQHAYRRRRHEAEVERKGLAILRRWARGEFGSRNTGDGASRNESKVAR